MKPSSNNFLKSNAFKIALHIIGWSIILLFPFIFSYLEGLNSSDIVPVMFFRNFFRISLLIVFFYLNSEFLIPRYLFRQKLYLYWIYILLFVAAIFVANSLFMTYVELPFVKIQRAAIEQIPPSQFAFRPPPPDSLRHAFKKYPAPAFSDRKNLNKMFAIKSWLIPTSFSVLLAFALSTSLKITSQWVKDENMRKDMATEKLQSELSFLKSQVNPHFLFNTLNNIYFLAYKKSDDTTTALFKLSQLMRYMLYESNVNKINLQKEIEYLENYIDLQKIRTTDNLQISLKKEGEIGAYHIEPMLLIPFVENAFKHGISNLEDCKIDISVSVKNEKLILKVSNKIFSNTSAITNDKGIGLQNVKRRLKLLYPAKHELVLNNVGNYYYVILKLFLTK